MVMAKVTARARMLAVAMAVATAPTMPMGRFVLRPARVVYKNFGSAVTAPSAACQA